MSVVALAAVRKSMPNERQAVTHRFEVAGTKGYVVVCLSAESGMPEEIFLFLAKEGSTLSGFADAFAAAFSAALQYGAPLSGLVDRFRDVRFEPQGRTRTPGIPEAASIVDYLVRWMEMRFIRR